VNVLLWHVHGSWTTAFVQGAHRVLIPTLPDRGPDGRGRARTWEWPASAVEVSPAEGADADVDVVILQRPHELHDRLAERWLGGRRPGREVPAVYVEHNAPLGRIADMRHPAADRPELTIAHVTHFNDLFWDPGTTPTRVIEHGIPDPGHRYTGEIPHAAVVVNEARRRGRVTGTDLLARFAQAAPLDLFGIDAGALGGFEDVPQERMHAELARRRVYLHPIRWTSLGLSLLEAMHLGMPVVALATTEAPEAIPLGAGVVSTRVDVLAAALRRFVAEPGLARAVGATARAAALERYGLARFLIDWDALLAQVVAEHRRTPSRRQAPAAPIPASDRRAAA
jgi:glycosyltransferase involved in cell wall biosynthesis